MSLPDYRYANCGNIIVGGGSATVCPYGTVPDRPNQCKTADGTYYPMLDNPTISGPVVGSNQMGQCLLNKPAENAAWACVDGKPACSTDTHFVNQDDKRTYTCHPDYVQKLPSNCSSTATTHTIHSSHVFH